MGWNNYDEDDDDMQEIENWRNEVIISHTYDTYFYIPINILF